LVQVQHGAGREVQQAFEVGVVLRREPGWLAVWAAGRRVGAWWHVLSWLVGVVWFGRLCAFPMDVRLVV
jgi:hypothetical protein